MLVLRSLVFQILFFLNMIVLILIWLPGLFMRRQVSQELGRTWGRTTLWLLDKIKGADTTVHVTAGGTSTVSIALGSK